MGSRSGSIGPRKFKDSWRKLIENKFQVFTFSTIINASIHQCLYCWWHCFTIRSISTPRVAIHLPPPKFIIPQNLYPSTHPPSILEASVIACCLHSNLHPFSNYFFRWLCLWAWGSHWSIWELEPIPVFNFMYRIHGVFKHVAMLCSFIFALSSLYPNLIRIIEVISDSEIENPLENTSQSGSDTQETWRNKSLRSFRRETTIESRYIIACWYNSWLNWSMY